MASSVCINGEISVLDDINEDNYTDIHVLEEIDSARDDNDVNSDHSKEGVDITPINSKMIQHVVIIMKMSILFFFASFLSFTN